MPVEAEEGAVLAGRFRLDRRLGEGGMGIVWAATNTTTRRRVAIKLLKEDRTDDPHVRRRFLREARAASAVQHPNVVEVLDVLELEDGTPAMVMELLEGESLGQRLRRVRKLSLADLAAVIVPAITAVGTAHAHGVVHRDLKPDNIFLARGLDDAVVVKVLDFGIAKIAADADAGHTEGGLTGTGAMLGTPYYMAPEQLFTDETIDYRCDIWALGIILYECLAGARPTKGDNFADIVKVIATQSIAPLRNVARDLPDEVSDLVMRMLSFDKEKRPQSLREVRDVLKHYTDVLASTFGDPVLAPVKQSLTDSSGVSSGLRKSDVELLLAGDETVDAPSRDQAGATTLDAPADRIAALAQIKGADTQEGLGRTLGGARPARRYAVLGGAFAAALAVLGAIAVRASHTADAQASPPPPATALAAPKVEAPPVAVETATPAPQAEAPSPVPTTPTPEVSAAPDKPIAAKARPRPQATARPASNPTSAATTADPAPRPAGGLVEKPPF